MSVNKWMIGNQKKLTIIRAEVESKNPTTIEHKIVKKAVIFLSDTVLKINAVMVEFLNTRVAQWAMVHLWTLRI